MVKIDDFLRALRVGWLLILVATFGGALAGLGLSYLLPTKYAATVSMYVSASMSASPNGGAYEGAQLSQNRIKSYLVLMSSHRVLDDVAQRLQLTESAESLASRISSSSPSDSVIINVSVFDRSPEGARAIANTVGAVFPDLVRQIEPKVSGNVPAVSVTVVDPAAIPMTPSSIGRPVLVAIGLLAGLVLGCLIALLRSAYDTSVRSIDELRELTSLPNLGSVAGNPDAEAAQLIVRDDPRSPRAEAFRHLRTNLQFLNVDEQRKVLVMTSSIAGEGKTTAILNLATAAASTGAKVLVIDGDLRCPTVSERLGLERAAGLTTVLAGRFPAGRVVQHWAGGSFDVLASGPIPPNPSELLSSRHMRAIIQDFRRWYDLVLIDSPPLLPVTDAAVVAPATDGVVLVCQLNRVKNYHVTAALDALRSVAATVLGTVATMVPLSRKEQAYGYYGRPSPTVTTDGATPSESPLPLDVKRPSPVPRPSPRPHADVLDGGRRESMTRPG